MTRSPVRVGCRAFSLVELLTVVVASSVVLSGFLGLYTSAVEFERRAAQDMEGRYRQAFAQDRILAKLRDATGVVRIRDSSGSPATGPVLLYERMELFYDAGANGYSSDPGNSRSITGVIYLAGNRLLLRERRPIRGNRLVAGADLVSEAAANDGASSRAAVVAFLRADPSTLPDTREEVVGTGVATFELANDTVRIVGVPGLATSLFGASFSLAHVSPPPTI